MAPTSETTTKKRKQPASTTKTPAQRKRFKTFQDARTISVQTSDKAFKNGEVDVDRFVKAREFEIKALEDGMRNAKKVQSNRAFQNVPRDLRRRTASHNVKRVPKRLRARAAREMLEDNTPTVTARRRKPTSHMRLRLDTAKRLQKLSSRTKAKAELMKAKATEEMDITVTKDAPTTTSGDAKPGASVKTRQPRVKINVLKAPPTPSAKFRKRQIHKSWLPTHLFHAKRAHMTPPKEPLWRFAIPLTPTAKSYRATHRASEARGAVAWDISYMATIGLEGPEKCIEGLLRALGVGAQNDPEGLWRKRGQKWRDGKRTWEGWVYERDGWPAKGIAPVTVIWCVEDRTPEVRNQGSVDTAVEQPAKKRRRKTFIRVHPSAFLHVWEETVRLSKVQKPSVSVEDLRFEIGSIEITGPASTEALVGILRASTPGADDGAQTDTPESVWKTLAILTNPASLPANALLAFTVLDPRLHHPPRTLLQTQDASYQDALLQLLATWPPDRTQGPPALFDRTARLAAARALPSQKAINRRKALAPPGQYPSALSSDPKIPVLLFASRASSTSAAQGGWTLLLPWKCVLPVWYPLMYYPLSTGGTVRFGGLREKRQVAFEAGAPWFPADFAGTRAGVEWEELERGRRKAEWERRPKGKRVEWGSVDLSGGRRGEIGMGWACDWERLLTGGERAAHPTTQAPPALTHLPRSVAAEVLNPTARQQPPPQPPTGALITVRLTLLTRGVSTSCARIYRLPTTNPALRQQWLSLVPSTANRAKARKAALPRPLPPSAPPSLRAQHLAAALLAPPPQPGSAAYPHVPGEEDLAGFVTSGNFSLGEGRGVGVGCLLLERVGGADREGKERRLCIVREAGQSVGRLARWEVA